MMLLATPKFKEPKKPFTSEQILAYLVVGIESSIRIIDE